MIGVLGTKKKKKLVTNLQDINLLATIKESKHKEFKIKNLVLNELNGNYDVLDFIKRYFDLGLESNHIASTSNKFNIQKLDQNKFTGIVNLKKTNDIRYINKFFESVNSILPNSAFYFGKVETYPNRKKAILKKYPLVINWLVYAFDITFTRILPKLLLTKKIYFACTKGKGRVLSKAETYGRLYSCGFEVVDEKVVDNMLYFVAKKVKDPVYDDDPTYGPVIRLKRVGKGGEKFNVYKFRTMHPFSEYLQEYIYNKNKLQEGGKIKNDFRISPEGKFLRRFWIDEIPMILNLIKGDMNLIGVRPISSHYFNLYDEDLKKLRIQFKPGLIPPFYADMPKSLEEIQQSEKKYLNLYKTSPISTNCKYFYKSLINIFFRGARSN